MSGIRGQPPLPKRRELTEGFNPLHIAFIVSDANISTGLIGSYIVYRRVQSSSYNYHLYIKYMDSSVFLEVRNLFLVLAQLLHTYFTEEISPLCMSFMD